MRRIISSSVACLLLPHFFTLSLKKQKIRGKKNIEHKIFFTFLELLSETFLILRRIQRDIIINVHTSSCGVSLILDKF